MIILDEVNRKLSDIEPHIKELGTALGLEVGALRLSELEHLSAEPNFWDNAENGRTVLAEMAGLKQKSEKYNNLCSLLEDAQMFSELAQEEGDEALLPEANQQVEEILRIYNEMHLETLLCNEYDANNAILTFHAGAGGTEAQDWVEMLYRMYNRYANNKNFKVQILDYQDGDDRQGIKSVSILIEGTNAYGYLKSESGVHRLVRISPFDSSGRRHTSFASLEVIPEIDDTVQIDIHPEDIRTDVYRASGAGGQHINKTSSAIRLTHIPSGIVVTCQNERSQLHNKEAAMKTLKSKLVQIKVQEHYDKIEDIKGVQNVIAWGSQIRSYVFMPYTLVKDHRTSFENGNVNAVMDGEIDGFINAYLKAENLEKLNKE